MDTKEGEKHLYRLVRPRDRAGKDEQQVWVIKDRHTNVLTDEMSVLRPKEDFEEMTNEEMRGKEVWMMWELWNRKLERLVKK